MQQTLVNEDSISAHSLETGIISSSPVLSLAIQHVLELHIDPFTCMILDPEAMFGHSTITEPDILVLAPQGWQEFAEWLAPLRRHFPHSPWLLFADPRIVGMFQSFLEPRTCALVPPTATPELFRATLYDLGEHRAVPPTNELLRLFASRVPSRMVRGQVLRPSAMELQCACAVSMGLSNTQIARLLCLQVATIKSHLNRFSSKMGLANRHEVAGLIHRALSTRDTMRHAK